MEVPPGCPSCSQFPDEGDTMVDGMCSTAGFSILINGKSCSFFQGKRGLRQGCPLSPYLFAIVMEFFSAVLTECEKNGLMPTPFVKGELAVSHLLFVDDVLIFGSASVEATGHLKRLLRDFNCHSGLGTNWS